VASRPKVRCAYSQILELSVGLESLGAVSTEVVRLQMSLWRDGLPLEAAPQIGWIEFVPAEPAEWD